MAKVSKARAAAERAARELSRKVDLYERVLRDYLEMHPYVTVPREWYQEGNPKIRGAVSATLHRVDGPVGGYIVVMWLPPGERVEKVHEVAYLEDWLDKTRDWLTRSGVLNEELAAFSRLVYAVHRERRAILDRTKEREEVCHGE